MNIALCLPNEINWNTNKYLTKQEKRKRLMDQLDALDEKDIQDLNNNDNSKRVKIDKKSLEIDIMKKVRIL